MTQDSEAAGAAGSSSWPRSGDVADTAASPMAAVGGAAMTLGSVLTIAGILVLFVIFAFGLVSLQYCFNSWDDGERQRLQQREQQASGRPGRRRRGGMSMSRRTATRGVDPELLRSLPVTVYRAGAAAPGSEKEADTAVECAVCLAELEDGEAARFLPRCGHGFHAECVDTWLASHTTCPLCRLTVAKPDAPPPALLLPVPPEPANYAAATLPAGVLLGVSDHATVAGGGGDTSGSTGARGVLAIEIPELVGRPTPTPRGAAKSPGSARLRSSFRRLWSFGRQGPGASSSCSCAGAGEGADLEQGVSVTADRPESNTKFLSSLQ
ncbi:unnamed protein product [Urochloa decumbens]|uniref:RING-type E3 ubiquitin transferase n=1 Tax=Urochloa decumbens TaxID=240449 RepID=A0ABC9CKU1_9POAL